MTTVANAVDQATLDELRAAVRGPVVAPGDPTYDAVRTGYNALHDRRPAAVVQAAGVADVITVVNHARAYDLPLAVRGGGHSIPGFSTCDDGLVLDLGPMRGIRVDPHRRTVRAEGGCTWGDLNHASHAFGLATTGGVQSTTGIAGLTLGGGMGFLARRYGLACDNLLSADVITADGRFLACSEDREPDLFWALRGGGGNFGVVTSFEYRLHPVADIFGGVTLYPLDGDVLRGCRDLLARAPDDLGLIFGVALGPPEPLLPERWHGRPITVALSCWSGPPEQDDAVRGWLHGLGPVVGEHLGRMPYPAINTLFDESLPAGLYHYWKGRFSSGLSDGAIDVHLRYGATLPCLQTATLLFPLDGAVQRVGPGDTAFAYRDINLATVFGASWPDPADTEANIAWTREYDDALAPHTEEAGYVNFLAADDAQRVPASYRQNYDRLVAVKRRYDPGNLFRLNHNIAP